MDSPFCGSSEDYRDSYGFRYALHLRSCFDIYEGGFIETIPNSSVTEFRLVLRTEICRISHGSNCYVSGLSICLISPAW